MARIYLTSQHGDVLNVVKRYRVVAREAVDDKVLQNNMIAARNGSCVPVGTAAIELKPANYPIVVPQIQEGSVADKHFAFVWRLVRWRDKKHAGVGEQPAGISLRAMDLCLHNRPINSCRAIGAWTYADCSLVRRAICELVHCILDRLIWQP